MQTTLKEIEKYKLNEYDTSPWKILLRYLNKTTADDEPLDFMIIHEAIGIKEAIGCLQTQDYYNYCLFLADVTELILPILETKFLNNKIPKDAIKAIRNWHNGNITKEQLKLTAYNVANDANAIHTTYDKTTYKAAKLAADIAYNTYAAATYATCNSNSIYNTFTHKENHTTIDARTMYATIIITDITNYTTLKSTWEDIDRLFIKHFGENKNANYTKKNRKI